MDEGVLRVVSCPEGLQDLVLIKVRMLLVPFNLHCNIMNLRIIGPDLYKPRFKYQLSSTKNAQNNW